MTCSVSLTDIISSSKRAEDKSSPTKLMNINTLHFFKAFSGVRASTTQAVALLIIHTHNESSDTLRWELSPHG